MSLTDNYPHLVDPQEESALQSGQRVFDRYLLDEVVGRGGMGVVWKAHDEKLDRTVALKFLPDLLFLNASARDELKRETRRCLELTHPHIVRIHDFLEDEDMAAIAMEYVDGSNLSELQVERPSRCFKPDELSEWLTSLCTALEYAHVVGHCVHRDLKPGNLMVNSRGELKVTDFGIACSTHAATRTNNQSSSSGTLNYMSPQQLKGDKPSASDDVYSVGATLYELLTGKPPFHSGDLSMQVREVVPESVMARRRSLGLPEVAIPEEWEETIAACLAKDPAKRPASGIEIARLLGLVEVAGLLDEDSLPFYKRLVLPNWRPAASRALKQLAARMASLKRIAVRMPSIKQLGAKASLKELGSRVAQLKQSAIQSTSFKQLGTWTAPLKQHRWPILTGVATLCAILPWFVKSHPQPQPIPAPPATSVVAEIGILEQPAAPVPDAPVASVAPVEPAATIAPVATATPVFRTAAAAPAEPAAPAKPVATATPVVTAAPVPVAPVATVASADSSASPVVPKVPQTPQTPDQRALTEPIPAPQSAAQSAPQSTAQNTPPQPSAISTDNPEARTQVRIETIPAGIPFQILAGTEENPTTQVRGFGVSPATLNLSQGGHRIVYSPIGQPSRTVSAQVPATGTALFQQEFPHGILKVDSKPQLVEVICDGHSVGNTPLDLPLLPGRHVITARWNSHEAEARTIEMAEADEQSLAFAFHTASTPAAKSTKSTATRSHHSKKKQDNSVLAKIGRTFKNLFGND